MYKNKFIPPADELTACTGRLIVSEAAPDQFYHGWYPVRKCSFPGHESAPGAGLPSSKRLTTFRNYRVVCEICDHQDNVSWTGEKEWCCPKNNVAPDSRNEATLSTCVTKMCVPDTYWRFHDKHLTKPNGSMPKNCRVHASNWFKEEIDHINSLNLIKKNITQHHRLTSMRIEKHMNDALKDIYQLKDGENNKKSPLLPLVSNQESCILGTGGRASNKISGTHSLLRI
ncbi:hypothetical protein BgiBS90_002408 [Biomphalaria glabrata]|nr:hypothetical protein BgiBS90_002408 [Biomphalaria glabrata]